jgi:hypothetical protein
MRMRAPSVDASVRYRGMAAPVATPSAVRPLELPLGPRLPSPAFGAKPSGYAAKDVLKGVLERWTRIKPDSAFAPERINPDAVIAGATETGRLPAIKPEPPTVTRDGLILFASQSKVPGRSILHSARLDASGALVAGPSTPVIGRWTRPPVLVARDLFLIAGEDALSLVARDSGDRLRVTDTFPLWYPLTPIFTDTGVIVIATREGSMLAFKVDGEKLVRTGFAGREADADWRPPFRLENGLFITVEANYSAHASTLIATRLEGDGTLRRVGQTSLGRLGWYIPAPKNHVVFTDGETKVTTVFEVVDSGHFAIAATSTEPINLAYRIIGPDGHGIAGDVDAYVTKAGAPYLFAPVHFSESGKIELNAKASFASWTMPLLTRNGTLIRTSTEGVTVEQLDASGTRTPRFTAPGVVAAESMVVTRNGTILVPTKDALVALGAKGQQ